MGLEAKKLELIQWLAKVKDENVIARLESVKDSEEEHTDWWDNLSAEIKAFVLRGIEDGKHAGLLPIKR